MMIFLFAYLTNLIYAIYAWTNMLCLKKFEMDLYCKDYQYASHFPSNTFIYDAKILC